MEPRFDSNNVSLECYPQLLSMVEQSMSSMTGDTSFEGLYTDLIKLCGEPLKFEWGNQLKMDREDAAYLQLKYGTLIKAVSKEGK